MNGDPNPCPEGGSSLVFVHICAKGKVKELRIWIPFNNWYDGSQKTKKEKVQLHETPRSGRPCTALMPDDICHINNSDIRWMSPNNELSSTPDISKGYGSFDQGAPQNILKEKEIWECTISRRSHGYSLLGYKRSYSCKFLIRWSKFSQKHNYEYMAKWWCLLAIENYMFWPVAAIIRFWQLSCYKSFIWYT